MSYLEELLPEFRKGAKIRQTYWDNSEYICLRDGKIIDENEVYFTRFYDNWLISDEWELYQEPVDWDYIIKNKCLCWFWDILEEAKIVGILCKINDDGEHKFVRNFEDAKIAYIHCRPVNRDEVNFYEVRKDD